MVVPDKVPTFRSSTPVSRVFGLENRLRFPDPYHHRAAGPKDVICFLKENEVGVYLAFFDAGLHFLLDKDLESILAFLCAVTLPF